MAARARAAARASGSSVSSNYSLHIGSSVSQRTGRFWFCPLGSLLFIALAKLRTLRALRVERTAASGPCVRVWLGAWLCVGAWPWRADLERSAGDDSLGRQGGVGERHSATRSRRASWRDALMRRAPPRSGSRVGILGRQMACAVSGTGRQQQRE